MTLAALLRTAASDHPNSGILLPGDGELLTYPALLDQALRILGGLQTLDRSPGSTVALLLGRPSDFIPTFWACVLGGYLPCPVVQGNGPPLAEIRAVLGDPLLVTVREPSVEGRTVDLAALRAAQPANADHVAVLSDPALLMLLPSASGAPLAVELTHANLLASLAAKQELLALRPDEVTGNWAPFAHGSAMVETHLLPLFVGATQLHTEPPADPMSLLHLLDRHHVALTFARNSTFEQLIPLLEPELDLDLTCVRHLISGGEAVSVATGRRFLELLAPYGLAKDVLRPAFGRPETCAGSLYSSRFPDGDAGRSFAALGAPLSGLEVRLAERDELQLRGPMVFHRYHDNEAATRAAFTADGWFRTGISGRFDDGQFVVGDPDRSE